MASLPADPLSDRTYRDKRALLGLATTAIALVKANLVPDKIPSLGVEHLTPEARAVLVKLLLIVLCYFVFIFVLHALTDCIQWRAALRREEAQLDAERAANTNVATYLATLEGVSEIHPSEIAKVKFEHEIAAFRLTGRLRALEEAKRSRWVKANIPATLVRLCIDFFFPLGCGAYASWCLLSWPG